jgi:hypothetical protein
MSRRLAPLALLAFILAGCDPLPASFSAVFPETDEAAGFRLAEEPIYVYDASGTVAGVAIADPDLSKLGGQGGGHIDGDALVLEWMGGACESRVYIVVARWTTRAIGLVSIPSPRCPGCLAVPPWVSGVPSGSSSASRRRASASSRRWIRLERLAASLPEPSAGREGREA